MKNKNNNFINSRLVFKTEKELFDDFQKTKFNSGAKLESKDKTKSVFESPELEYGNQLAVLKDKTKFSLENILNGLQSFNFTAKARVKTGLKDYINNEVKVARFRMKQHEKKSIKKVFSNILGRKNKLTILNLRLDVIKGLRKDVNNVNKSIEEQKLRYSKFANILDTSLKVDNNKYLDMLNDTLEEFQVEVQDEIDKNSDTELMKNVGEIENYLRDGLMAADPSILQGLDQLLLANANGDGKELIERIKVLEKEGKISSVQKDNYIKLAKGLRKKGVIKEAYYGVKNRFSDNKKINNKHIEAYYQVKYLNQKKLNPRSLRNRLITLKQAHTGAKVMIEDDQHKEQIFHKTGGNRMSESEGIVLKAEGKEIYIFVSPKTDDQVVNISIQNNEAASNNLQTGEYCLSTYEGRLNDLSSINFRINTRVLEERKQKKKEEEQEAKKKRDNKEAEEKKQKEDKEAEEKKQREDKEAEEKAEEKKQREDKEAEEKKKQQANNRRGNQQGGRHKRRSKNKPK